MIPALRPARLLLRGVFVKHTSARCDNVFDCAIIQQEWDDARALLCLFGNVASSRSKGAHRARNRRPAVSLSTNEQCSRPRYYYLHLQNKGSRFERRREERAVSHFCTPITRYAGITCTRERKRSCTHVSPPLHVDGCTRIQLCMEDAWNFAVVPTN